MHTFNVVYQPPVVLYWLLLDPHSDHCGRERGRKCERGIVSE